MVKDAGIHLRLDPEVVRKLQMLKSKDLPTMSYIIRKIIEKYLASLDAVNNGEDLVDPFILPKKAEPEVVPRISPDPPVYADRVRPVAIEQPSIPRGLDHHAVVRARRAKRLGLPFDADLDAYYDLI